MSKTLTEQWKNGKLEKGTYWCVSSWIDEIRMFYFEGDYFIDCDVPLDDDNIEEVLAPVPSYDEVKDMSQKIERLEFDNETLEMAHNEGKEINAELVSKTEQLEKKLKIATKALKNAHKFPSTMSLKEYCKQALKEMEGIK